MRVALSRHPDFPCDAVRSIAVELEPAGPSALAVRYLVAGDVGQVALPSPAAPERADELWRHTCMEAFARDVAGEGYVEFNLSPSTQWACYSFNAYREGMRVHEAASPQIATVRSARGFELCAILDLRRAASRLGLSAVIEERGGRISYWALRHPPGRADFHHADGFALELPAPSAS